MQKDTQQIIGQVKKGDHKAFRLLVEKYQQFAFTLAFRILCDEDEAKDATQESFIKIWKNIKNYNPKMKFTTWMYKIVTNTAIDRLRTKSRVNMVSLEAVSENLDGLREDPGKKIDNKEAAQLIRAIAEDLPEKQKLTFVLRDIQGLSSEEVQTILDIPENSVKSNLYHARKAVKKKLNALVSYGLTYKGSNYGM